MLNATWTHIWYPYSYNSGKCSSYARDYVDPDGVVGPKTMAKAKCFQLYYGLDADGIVGPQTWHKMYGLCVNNPSYYKTTWGIACGSW
jgi:peptidoglycan hydrolase-like protein with peptidoglycan-binding domain